MSLKSGRWIAGLLATAALLVIVGCSGDDDPTPTTQATAVSTATTVPVDPTATTVLPTPIPPTPTRVPPTPTATPSGPSFELVSIDADAANIRVDGKVGDWAQIPGKTVTLQQSGPIEGYDFGEVDPIEAVLKVAADANNVYVLVRVPDEFLYDPADHNLSPALAVMFQIEDGAGAAMGADEDELDNPLGLVDLWHWELDCAPGARSGGGAISIGGVAGGNDPPCNFDDEYSTEPTEREDDDTTDAENSLVGVWEHTARSQGVGADGDWIFEMSRPLDTNDSRDATLRLSNTHNLALAYWAADETAEGWTDAGHLQTASKHGWVQVTLPTQAQARSIGPSFDLVTINVDASTKTVDGDVSDWVSVPSVPIRLQQSGPIPGYDFGIVDPIDVNLKVAADAKNVYMLVEVPDEFIYDPDNHNLSPALAVMLEIQSGAGPAMGADEDDLDTALGLVDIWHWELDCAPGTVSGGGLTPGGLVGGNDPPCNFDDEYSTEPTEREDDGTTTAENSLVGVWEHTARSAGPGADGMWIFEMSRPLDTGDEQDAELRLGATEHLALAYWAADETAEGWTDAGHLQSASRHGWIDLVMPTASTVASLRPPGATIAAAPVPIVVDGDIGDWVSVPKLSLTLEQPLPVTGYSPGVVAPTDVDIRVAADNHNLYVLMEVHDDYDFDPANHNLSAALAVMLKIDEAAGTAMGAIEEDQETSLGLVDIWHWELDCAPGAQSGGAAISIGGVDGGNDPPCNLDDEYSTIPTEREDDGTVTAENSLLGVWEHTARAQGNGADGTWIFEMSRPLFTGDPQDAQLEPGMRTSMALAYWDADETAEGWTDVGHLQSANFGWIDIVLPSPRVALTVPPPNVALTAATRTISIDGSVADWANIEGAKVVLKQPLPIPGFDPGVLPPQFATIKVATNVNNLYMLLEVPDDFDYDPTDHNKSAALAVLIPIATDAGLAMGADELDIDTSLGLVDIWHWELDCAPGSLSGGGAIQGGGVSGGNDPPCNFDDEYSTDPSEREDDGALTAQNSLIGSWNHTARAQGIGAEGTWIFEMSRPLNTGDSQDAVFTSGETVLIALAYWDADETAEGWTAVGHLQSTPIGWIEVTLP